MKATLLFLLLFSSTWVIAQLGARTNSSPFVYYYPFYDGVQMIELDYLTAYQQTINHLEWTEPRAMHWDMVLPPPSENVYIFRNEAGKVVKHIGAIKAKEVELLSPSMSQTVARPHNHFSTRMQSSQVQTRFFPYYLIGVRWGHHSQLGLIDSLGNQVLAPIYNRIVSNLEGTIFMTKRDSISELRDHDLTVHFSSTTYTFRPSNIPNVVRFYRDRLYGLMTIDGTVVIPCRYRLIESSSNDGLWRVCNQRGFEGVVDSTGAEVIPCLYQCVGRFKEGLVNVRYKDRWGYLNTQGEIVIPFEYDIGNGLKEGLAMVSKKIEGVYYFGFINAQGQEVVPLKYSNATDFKNGVARVRVDFPRRSKAVAPDGSFPDNKSSKGQWIKIDRRGNVVR